MADYITVRDQLQEFIGQRLVEVTQHDEEEYRETGEAYIMLMFENGAVMQITLREGQISIPEIDYKGDQE